ncbi:MAG: anhydro-N-acetylmuramic acid kinase [Burkholderiaceae bacterium]|nr:anhydro-N-acetylmuramic acid kinase [Burkholderiaceae bacterium]
MMSKPLFIGLMSGTSLDGVDGVLAEFAEGRPRLLQACYTAFPPDLRAELMALQSPGGDEIRREALAANLLVDAYTHCVQQLLQESGVAADKVQAIGCHGQTVRHNPLQGYTRQTNNPALLAERCGIDVIADFRSRDVAAGGHGAPLVPAFHRAIFGAEGRMRVVANIGGMANISILDGMNEAVIGFDTGPGNVFLDLWAAQHLGQPYDAGGQWGAGGQVVQRMLATMLAEPFFDLAPPKSTGRDLFDPVWLLRQLAAFPQAAPQDVQATLCALTAQTLADAIARHAASAEEVYVCGGGAYNAELLRGLQRELHALGSHATVSSTDVLGVAPNHVEALAFAWLAERFTARQPGNLATVTGARGPRILGALYPA